MIIKILAGAAVAGAALAGSAGAASAAVQHPAYVPPRVAVGSVELGSPEQHAVFQALQGFGHNHGFVDYTNFTYAAPGSGVWAPASQTDQLTFVLGNSSYAHTLNGGLVLKAVSPGEVRFSGTGHYNASAADTWTIQGDIKGDHISFTITYGAWNPGYVVTATGTIAKDGSASGAAKDTDHQALTWTLPKGTFQQVLHFVASDKDAQVNYQTRTAEFDFVIPNGPLAGTPVIVKVHGAANPTWAHGVGLIKSNPALTGYPVEAGHIVIP